MPTSDDAEGEAEGEGERVLAGGWQTDVREAGGVVYRAAGPHSATVIALLHHLAAVGFEAAPRPVGAGFAPDGREMLGYVAGESPQPRAWSDAAAWRVGHLLGELHEATAAFVAPTPAVWQSWFGRDLPGVHPVIGHGDLGPWNILARDGVPVAFIDWDSAGPVDGVWELAQVAWLNAQLHDDDAAALSSLPDLATRARQLGLIADGYGLDRADRVGFVDQMIELALRSARQEAIDPAVTPATTSPAPDGYPITWAIAWRSRSAAWMLDHRQTLDRALGV